MVWDNCADLFSRGLSFFISDQQAPVDSRLPTSRLMTPAPRPFPDPIVGPTFPSYGAISAPSPRQCLFSRDILFFPPTPSLSCRDDFASSLLKEGSYVADILQHFPTSRSSLLSQLLTVHALSPTGTVSNSGRSSPWTPKFAPLRS